MEILTALASHTAHLVATGVPVDRDTLLDPDRVDAWLLRGDPALSYGTTANYRSRLARVAKSVQGTRQQEATPMPASDPARAYLRREEARLTTWALGLSRTGQREDVCAAVGVLLGTGTTAAEAMSAQGRRVGFPTGGGITFRLGARVVPVREQYRTMVARAAERAGVDGFLVMPDVAGRGGRNGLSNLVDRALQGHTGVPRLTPQRTRATWVVRQMEAGTRADVLVEAAGVTSLAALARYVPQMDASTASDFQSLRLLGEQP